MFKSLPNTKINEDENPYWITFSDLMSGLLVIFILATVALIIELTQKTELIDDNITELKKAEMVRKAILDDIKQNLSEKSITVHIVENYTVIRIPEETLTFASGKDTLPDNETTQTNVKEIGQSVVNAITKESRFKYLDTVFIEGHTDSESIYYRGKGNWGLSVDRAVSVWKSWQQINTLNGVNINDIVNHKGDKLFSASGYASTRRVNVSESTETERAKNRRIDIRFTIKKATIEEFNKIKAI